MADPITKDEMLEALREIFPKSDQRPGRLPKFDYRDQEQLSKAIKESTDAIKKNITFGRQFEQVLRGQRAQYEDYSKEVEALDKELSILASSVSRGAGAVEEYNAKLEIRNAVAFQHQLGQARAGVQNFAVGMGEVLQNLFKATWNYVKQLQDGASGVEAGSNLAAEAAQQTGNTISEIGKLMGALGPIIGGLIAGLSKIIPAFKNVPVIGKFANAAGIAIAGLGIGAEILGTKMGTIAREGVEYLGKELIKTERAFREITQAGAVVGGGMDELRQIAAGAGLDITQLSNVVKASRDDLAAMGLGLGEATKRIAAVSGELRRSELGMQLRKLGYSAEEQASLAASLSARLSASGDNRIRSDAEVARLTNQYGKDLRILADITGQDAKKKMEEARMRAQEQDLLAEAMRKGGPEAMRKLEAQLATMPQALKKGYMEFVSTGGSAIADAATNVAIVQNPKILEQYQQMYTTLGDSSKDASAALTETGTLTEQTVKYARENAEASKEIGIAARLVGTSITRAATDIYNEMIVEAGRRKEGATAAAAANVEALSVSMAPLNQSVAQINENADKLRSAIADKVTPALNTFAEKMALVSTTVDEQLRKLGVKIDETKQTVTGPGAGERIGQAGGELAGNVVGTVAGAALGRAATTKIGAAIGTAIMPGIGTAIGAGLGFLAGGLLGNITGKLGAYIGKKFDEPAAGPTGGSVADVPMAANGNILTGPMQGYLAMLHGTEAVVPLPDGRRIPVNLDLSELTTSINKLSTNIEAPTVAADPGKDTYNKIYQEIQTMTAKSERTSESMMRDQLSLLNEIKEILTASNSLQQQYVYNTYN